MEIFILRYQDLITELRKVGDTSELEGKTFILASDGYVFVFDDSENIADEFNSRYFKPEDDAYGISADMDMYDLYRHFEDYVFTGSEYFIVGKIENNIAFVHTERETDPDSILNKEVKKLVKELNLDGIMTADTVYYDDNDLEVEEFVSRNDVIDSVVGDGIFYHGTSLEVFDSIMKKGIYHTGNSTNFGNIVHEENTVFVTTKYKKALFHAIHSAKKTNSAPVVIKLKIPEPYRLILDYDIAIDKYGIKHPLVQQLGYDYVFNNTGATQWIEVEPKFEEEWKNIIDKSSYNTKAGIFGYKGRIPPSNFIWFATDPEAAVVYEYFGNIKTYGIEIDVSNLPRFKSLDEFNEVKNHYKELLEIDVDDEDDENY